MLTELKKKAASLLKSGEVSKLICFVESGLPGMAKPAFITDADNLEKIIFSEQCTSNLAVYLSGATSVREGKTAIVADSGTLRAIAMLIVENQLKREELHIFAVKDGGNAPWELANEVFESGSTHRAEDPARKEELAKLRELPRSERWEFWQKQFSACIRCYACRQACPMCYCERCIVEKNQPQWVPTAIHDYGNFVWNITRAYHLSGRCVGCEACDNACPAGIPLRLLNQHLCDIAKVKFNWEAGMDAESKPPFMTADINDSIDFVE